MTVTFDPDAWQAEVESERESTRDYYLTQFNWRGMKPPEGFDGPRYFPVNVEWRKSARLDRNAPGTGMRVQLLTSIGDLRDFDVAGVLVFEHEGQEQRLTAYTMVTAGQEYDTMFVPFKDATTGKESYGAGRYIDLPGHENDDYILDFNTAYNPLCAYSPRYNCPYPPPQNTLKVAVKAGEMTPVGHD